MMILYGKCTRALTFENFLKGIGRRMIPMAGLCLGFWFEGLGFRLWQALIPMAVL
jgi:hypothetical protein